MICLVKYKDAPVLTAEFVAERIAIGQEVIVVPDGITLEVYDYQPPDFEEPEQEESGKWVKRVATFIVLVSIGVLALLVLGMLNEKRNHQHVDSVPAVAVSNR